MLLLLNLKFLLHPGDIFLLCSEENVSHTAMHILYWFTLPFLQKKGKKKYQKSTCLNKKISMFKVPCLCDLIKKKKKKTPDGGVFFFLSACRLSPNTLARLNRFTFHPRLLILVRHFKKKKHPQLRNFLKQKKEKHYRGRFNVVKQQQQQQLWQSELSSVTDTYHGADRGEKHL